MRVVKKIRPAAQDLPVGSRLEIRKISDGSFDVFVKPEHAQGRILPMLVTACGPTDADAIVAMRKKLYTPTCQSFAEALGDSLDSRAFGAWMEQCAKNPGAMITDAEAMAAADRISIAARKFRQALMREEGKTGGDVISATWDLTDRTRLGDFRLVLGILCELPDALADAGYEAHEGRGRMPRGGVDWWLIDCFMHGWDKSTGQNVSAAVRSKFMRHAPNLLSLVGVELGDDPEGRVRRLIRRNQAARRSPLGVVNSKKYMN